MVQSASHLARTARSGSKSGSDQRSSRIAWRRTVRLGERSTTMPRYLIERIFEDPDVDEEKLSEVGQRASKLIGEQYHEVVWEHSHVVSDDEGTIRSFCIYSAPDAQMLQDHADAVGFHRVGMIYQIGGDVSPSDFPD
jgi:hypothetical protein